MAGLSVDSEEFVDVARLYGWAIYDAGKYGVSEGKAMYVTANEKDLAVEWNDAAEAAMTTIRDMAGAALDLAAEAPMQEDEGCPGCGWKPGDGINSECDHPDGCGYWKSML